MNPRAVLQERYPDADFAVYFRFLDACSGTKSESGRTHDHHICPRKQFPEYAEGFRENLITLTIEDHAFVHKLLEGGCGIKSPPTAYFEMQRGAAVKGGLSHRGKKRTEETRRKMSEAMRGKKHTEETRRKLGDLARGNKNCLGRRLSDETRSKIAEAVHNCSAEARRNMAEAQRGKKHTEETRRKMSEAQLGHKHTEESKQKMAESQRGKKLSEETRRKIAEAHRGVALSAEHVRKASEANRGKKRTEETRRKLSQVHRGRPSPLRGRPLSEEQRQKLRKPHLEFVGNERLLPLPRTWKERYLGVAVAKINVTTEIVQFRNGGYENLSKLYQTKADSAKNVCDDPVTRPGDTELT